MPFLLLYWKWIAAAALIAALTIAYNVHVNGLIHKAVDKAVLERDDQWRDKEQEAIDKAKAAAKATEAAHAKELGTIRTKYQKEVADAKSKKDRDVDGARSGDLSLRVPSGCPSAANVSGAATGPSRGDGPSTVELPRETTASLYSLANDADAVADQLRACQTVTQSDRSNP